MQHSPTTVDPQQAVEALERQLRDVPAAARPAQHATLRYRLGMAIAELPTGDRQLNLTRAVSHYDRAAALFRPAAFPLEHARVQSARAAALRESGNPAGAADAGRAALRLLPDLAGVGERGAVANNLGLALSDLGSHAEAVEVVEGAAKMFDAAWADAGAEVAPHRATAHHNLAQVLGAAGRHDDAIAVCRAVLDDIDPQELPFQWALLQHAMGVSATAAARPAEAVTAFQAALQVFSRTRHPFQHALAKNNLGLGWSLIGDVTALRRATVAYSDALSVLDFRVHKELWQQAYANLGLAETALADADAPRSLTAHFVILLGGLDHAERQSLMRERLTRLLELPEPRRSESLTEIEMATLALPEAAAIAVTGASLSILLELPNQQLSVGLQAHLAAQQALDEEAQLDQAAWVLERAIADEMLAPQRIRVRDMLTDMGYDRR